MEKTSTFRKSKRSVFAVSIAVIILGCAAGAYFLWIRPRSPLVQYTLVHTQSLKNVIFASGVVKPTGRQIVNVTDLPGPVSKMDVKVGQRVKSGHLLLECQNQSLLASLHTAQQQEADASKSLLSVQKRLQSLQSSLSGLSGTSNNTVQEEISGALQSQLESSLAEQLQSAQSALDEAKTTVAQAKAAYEATRIKATVSGTVLIANPDGIQSDGTTGPVIEIATGQQVVANVSESDAVNLRKGMGVTVSSQAFPGKTWTASVEQVSPYATTDTSGNGQVEVTIGGLPKNFPVPLGYQVNMNIVSAIHRSALVVPYSALVQQGTDYAVYALKSNKTQEVPVTLGITTNSVVEVVSGLKRGEKVVVNPPSDLKSNQQVRTR